jgi:hypothetical protein
MTERLHPADVEMIADRVAAKILAEFRSTDPSPPATGLLDAKQLATKLNVSAGWIYEHANELGAQRLGTGSKPRLRFDQRIAEPAIAGIGTQAAPVRQRRRERINTSDVPLLPIAGTDPETTTTPQTRGRRATPKAKKEVAGM